MNAYSKQELRNKLWLTHLGIDFATSRPYFYAQGTFDWQCRLGKIKKKSHIYLYYRQGRRGKQNRFQIIKPGENDKKYLIAEIDETDIDYNYKRTTDGCIISYTDMNTKKNCKVVLTPCHETKRQTKYRARSCPSPGVDFETPNPSIENWKYLLNLWILESPSRGAGKSKSKHTRKSSPSRTPSTGKSSPSRTPSTRKSSPSRTPSTGKSLSLSTRKTPSRRGGARNYHKATKKRRRKKIKKTRKNK